MFVISQRVETRVVVSERILEAVIKSAASAADLITASKSLHVGHVAMGSTTSNPFMESFVATTCWHKPLLIEASLEYALSCVQ